MESDSEGFRDRVIIRVAGLSSLALHPFADSDCAERAEALVALSDELQTLRSRLVEILHEKIEGTPTPERRTLLGIKRDCFNGRPLSPRLAAADWEVFARAMPGTAERLRGLEEGLAALQAELGALLRAQQEREGRHLLALLDDGNFYQGLSLAAPEVLRNLDRIRQPIASYGRKERRLMQSLVRYVCRAALKLSPFSTLTRLGLATADANLVERPAHLCLAGAQQLELRRIKKHTVIKYFALLRRYPAFRELLELKVNPTLEAVGAGRYRFISVFHWEFKEEAREFWYFNEAQVFANLKGPLIDAMLAQLLHGVHYGAALRLLAEQLGSERNVVEKVILRLLDLGVLLLDFPWRTNDVHPERRLLEFLAQVAWQPVLSEFTVTFGQLVTLVERRAPTQERLRTYEEIDRLRMQGFHLLTTGLGLPEAKEEINEKQVNEDVFLVHTLEPEESSVARLSGRSVVEALACARPMLLYSDLNYTRYEFLHSLKALIEKQWPGRSEVPFLDVFEKAQPLWGEYVKAASSAIVEWRPDLWNPFHLPEVEALNRLREEVLRDFEAAMQLQGDELVIDRDRAERAVERIPPQYTPAFGPCLFAQPASERGEQWFVNHMLDGTGRFSNRYTTAMPPALSQAFSAQLGRGGEGASLFGEPAEMIEILCSRDDHLNVHRVQTKRVLEMPGENSDLPAERRLSVREVNVSVAGPMPFLVDLAGSRLLPIFLGTNGLVGMPTLVRFLSRFGIGEYRLIHPPRPALRENDLIRHRRLRIGNLILRRQMWVVQRATAFPRLEGLSDADAFLALTRWRLARGLPKQVFVAERMKSKFDLWPLHKPQYLDFTSPSFLPIVRAVIENAADELRFEEVLPAPGAFPRDEHGEPRAMEAQLETIALRATRAWLPCRPCESFPVGQVQMVEI
jgi:hypothetical protein